MRFLFRLLMRVAITLAIVTVTIIVVRALDADAVAGPGTARLRVGITDVDDTIGVLNISIYTKITGAGLGGAAFEGEVVDSMTGEQIAAVSRWGSGSRILRAGYTHTGDAKILMDRWAKNMRKRLDDAHGR